MLCEEYLHTISQGDLFGYLMSKGQKSGTFISSCDHKVKDDPLSMICTGLLTKTPYRLSECFKGKRIDVEIESSGLTAWRGTREPLLQCSLNGNHLCVPLRAVPADLANVIATLAASDLKGLAKMYLCK